jgi:hypothetical protein
MKIMKVFDCQWNEPKMPEDVKRAFFDLHREDGVGNDVYVEWEVQWDDVDYDSDDEFAVKRRLLDNWLLEHGAMGRQLNGGYHGETVLIKHWW